MAYSNRPFGLLLELARYRVTPAAPEPPVANAHPYRYLATFIFVDFDQMDYALHGSCLIADTLNFRHRRVFFHVQAQNFVQLFVGRRLFRRLLKFFRHWRSGRLPCN